VVTDLIVRMFIAFQGIGARARDDEDGQTLAEYGLIMAVIAVAVVVAAGVAFRGAIIGAFNDAGDCIAGAGITGVCR